MIEYAFVDVKWCKIHHSSAPLEGDHCYWDKAIGPRPGRGLCEFWRAKITVRRLEPSEIGGNEDE